MLKTVDLSRNKLKEFPLFLCQLIHVNFVDLSTNQITQIPEGIEVISAVEINLNQNQITVLPESLARCKRLKVLRLEENCISASGIPPAVLTDSVISLLCLEGNVVDMRELKQLPEYDKVSETVADSFLSLSLYHPSSLTHTLSFPHTHTLSTIVYGKILSFKEKGRLIIISILYTCMIFVVSNYVVVVVVVVFLLALATTDDPPWSSPTLSLPPMRNWLAKSPSYMMVIFSKDSVGNQ